MEIKSLLEKALKIDTDNLEESNAYTLLRLAKEIAKEAEEIYRVTLSPDEANAKIEEIDRELYPVEFRETEDDYVFILPPLINKKRGSRNLTGVGERIEDICLSRGIERESGRVVHFVNKIHDSRRVQDYDNLDTREILNALAVSILTDDNWKCYTLVQSADVIEDSEPERCEIYVSKEGVNNPDP